MTHGAAPAPEPCRREQPWRTSIRWLLATLLTALLAVGGACAQEMAGLRFVHLSPDAPQVDVVVSDGALVKDVAYGTATGYLPIVAGEHEVRVFPHRLPEDESSNGENGENGEDGENGESEAAPPPPEVARLEPITRTVTFAPEHYYTVVLSGFYEPAPDDEVGALSLDVEPGSAQSTLEGPRGFEETVEGDALWTDLAPGDYTLAVSAEGFQSYRQEVVVRPLRTAVIAATLQASDDEQSEENGGEGADTSGGGEEVPVKAIELHLFDEAQLSLPPPGAASVRLVHASPLAPPVDVVFETQPTGRPEAQRLTLASGLAYPNATDVSAVATASGVLTVHVAGSDNVLVRLPRFTFRGGAVYTLYIASDASEEAWLVPTVSALVRNDP